jgi:hypothetical protein
LKWRLALAAIVLDKQPRFLQNSTSLNGSESGGGLSPLGSAPLPDPRFRRINSAGKRKRKEEP